LTRRNLRAAVPALRHGVVALTFRLPRSYIQDPVDLG